MASMWVATCQDQVWFPCGWLCARTKYGFHVGGYVLGASMASMCPQGKKRTQGEEDAELSCQDSKVRCQWLGLRPGSVSSLSPQCPCFLWPVLVIFFSYTRGVGISFFCTKHIQWPSITCGTSQIPEQAQEILNSPLGFDFLHPLSSLMLASPLMLQHLPSHLSALQAEWGPWRLSPARVVTFWPHWVMATGITVMGGWFLQAFEIQFTREKLGLLELPWCNPKVIAKVLLREAGRNRNLKLPLDQAVRDWPIIFWELLEPLTLCGSLQPGEAAVLISEKKLILPPGFPWLTQSSRAFYLHFYISTLLSLIKFQSYLTTCTGFKTTASFL
jgi:hypothetical protein